MDNNRIINQTIDLFNHDKLRVHNLKILDKYYQEVHKKTKTFEIRINDRNYKVGDIIQFTVVNEARVTLYQPIVKYMITYILSDNELLKTGYIVMSIVPYRD